MRSRRRSRGALSQRFRCPTSVSSSMSLSRALSLSSLSREPATSVPREPATSVHPSLSSGDVAREGVIGASLKATRSQVRRGGGTAAVSSSVRNQGCCAGNSPMCSNLHRARDLGSRRLERSPFSLLSVGLAIARAARAVISKSAASYFARVENSTLRRFSRQKNGDGGAPGYFFSLHGFCTRGEIMCGARSSSRTDGLNRRVRPVAKTRTKPGTGRQAGAATMNAALHTQLLQCQIGRLLSVPFNPTTQRTPQYSAAQLMS